MTIVQRHISEVSIDVLKEVTNEVLAILKVDNLKDIQRKQEIEAFLDKLSDTTFNDLTVLASKISDLDASIQAQSKDAEETIMVDVDLEQEAEGDESDKDDVYVYDPQNEEEKTKNDNDEQMHDSQDLRAVKIGEVGALSIESELQNFIKNQKDAKQIISSITEDKLKMLIKYYSTINQLENMDISKDQYQDRANKAKEDLYENIE